MAGVWWATWPDSSGATRRREFPTELNRYTHTPDGYEERVLAAFGEPTDFSPTPEDQPDVNEGEEDESCSP